MINRRNLLKLLSFSPLAVPLAAATKATESIVPPRPAYLDAPKKSKRGNVYVMLAPPFEVREHLRINALAKWLYETFPPTVVVDRGHLLDNRHVVEQAVETAGSGHDVIAIAHANYRTINENLGAVCDEGWMAQADWVFWVGGIGHHFEHDVEVKTTWTIRTLKDRLGVYNDLFYWDTASLEARVAHVKPRLL